MGFKYHALKFVIQTGIVDVLYAGVDAFYKHNFFYAMQDPKNIETAVGIATGLLLYDIGKTLYKSHMNKPKVDSLITRAHKLGIETLGKTAEEISNEINEAHNQPK